MKKRLIALFLCVALLSGLFTTLVYADPDGAIRIYSDGQPVDSVAVPVNGSATVEAVLPGGVNQGIGQWEIYVSSIGTWVAVHGATGTTLRLSAALLANAMDENYSAQVRYSFTDLGSATVKAYLSYEGEYATLEARDVDETVTPIVTDTGHVEVHYCVEPATDDAADETDTDATEADSADNTDSTEAAGEAADVQPAAPAAGDTTAPTDSTTAAVPAATETAEPAAETPAVTEPETDAPEATMLSSWFSGRLILLADDSDESDAGDAAVPAAETTPDVKQKYTIVVNYNLNTGEQVASPYTAELAEGSSFSATVTFPTVMGYLPYVNGEQMDSIDLNYPSVSENVTINVVYEPTYVNYTVIRYQQNVENDLYTPVETNTYQGLTGSEPEFEEKEYDGFYGLLYERPLIAADGSTVIEIYYDRCYYLMNFDMDGGYGTEPVYARYGASIGTVTAPTKAGYTFQGWSLTKPTGNVGEEITIGTLPTTMPAYSVTYYAVWKGNDKVAMTIVVWGENADDDDYTYVSSSIIMVDPNTGFSYDQTGTVVCGIEEHTHSDACLACGKSEHTHSAVGGSCYTLTCTIESHTHSTSCYDGVGDRHNLHPSAPDNPTNGQVYHSDGFFGAGYTIIYINGTWYNYTGSTASGSIAPTTCGKNESTHTHTDSCYKLTCTAEEHTHSASCYSCGKEEHTHIAACSFELPKMDSNLWVLNTEKSESTDSAAYDGSTVINVYYDRTEKTLTFKYDYSSRNSYQKTSTITAKWGENIATEYNAIVEAAGSSFWSADSNYSSPYTNYFGVMPQESKTYYYQSDNGRSGTMYYYGEDLNGDYVEMFHVDNVGGYTVTVEDHYEFLGFTYDRGTSNGSSCSNAKFYYTRNSYGLEFNNGESVIKTESVKYEAPLGQYDFTPTEVPSKYEPGSVEFAGWYLNPECTGEEYILSQHTMPAGAQDGDNALVLYAKWVPVTHTVKFYLTEKSESVYKPEKADTEASFTVSHGDNIAEEYVTNHLEIKAMNEAKPNGDYQFVMWYYYENGNKKPFDPTTQIRKDLTLYGEWSSNTLKQYTVQYVLQSDPSVKVADDLTGSGLAGTTKTFDAKGGTELYAGYQEGYFPTVQSQSLLLDINADSLVVTFEYVPMPAVPYTVRYVDKDTGASLAEDKVVSDNRKAVVTETFKSISGYMPDAYQKRLVVTADGENVLYFYYTKDETHAYYKITHYTQNTDGATWMEYASSQAVGDIGTRYTASPMTIPGFTYSEIKYVVSGTEVTDVTAEGAKLTADGLEINLYYVRNDYPYKVRYLEQGSGKVLHEEKSGTGKYGQMVSESAIDIDGYDKVDPTSVALSIRIDDGEGAPNINLITFYYTEKEVPITYVAVGPAGATGFGSVSPTAETVKIKTGTAQGSVPTAGEGFKFVGWYKDANCTEPVDASWVTDNRITPQKNDDGKNVQATYYAKFEYDVADLTITKSGADLDLDPDQTFIFTVTGPDGYSTTVAVKGNSSVTIKGLKIGTYTVHEDSGWSWRYSCGDQTITLQPAVTNNVTMVNSRGNDKWLDGNSYSENVFNR